MVEISSLHYTLMWDDNNIIPLNLNQAYFLEVSHAAHKF